MYLPEMKVLMHTVDGQEMKNNHQEISQHQTAIGIK